MEYNTLLMQSYSQLSLNHFFSKAHIKYKLKITTCKKKKTLFCGCKEKCNEYEKREQNGVTQDSSKINNHASSLLLCHQNGLRRSIDYVNMICKNKIDTCESWEIVQNVRLNARICSKKSMLI
jgi:hypothetical protein